jgi:hypothetical protein
MLFSTRFEPSICRSDEAIPTHWQTSWALESWKLVEGMPRVWLNSYRSVRASAQSRSGAHQGGAKWLDYCR